MDLRQDFFPFLPIIGQMFAILMSFQFCSDSTWGKIIKGGKKWKKPFKTHFFQSTFKIICATNPKWTCENNVVPQKIVCSVIFFCSVQLYFLFNALFRIKLWKQSLKKCIWWKPTRCLQGFFLENMETFFLFPFSNKKQKFLQECEKTWAKSLFSYICAKKLIWLFLTRYSGEKRVQSKFSCQF